jgi:betaine-aldehyde dehydrogenase
VERIDKIVEEANAQGARVIVRGCPTVEGPPDASAVDCPTLLEVEDGTDRCR